MTTDPTPGDELLRYTVCKDCETDSMTTTECTTGDEVLRHCVVCERDTLQVVGAKAFVVRDPADERYEADPSVSLWLEYGGY